LAAGLRGLAAASRRRALVVRPGFPDSSAREFERGPSSTAAGTRSNRAQPVAPTGIRPITHADTARRVVVVAWNLRCGPGGYRNDHRRVASGRRQYRAAWAGARQRVGRARA